MIPAVLVCFFALVLATFVVRRELLQLLMQWGLRRGARLEGHQRSEGVPWTAYVIPDYVTGAPYITRFRFPRMFGFRPMLHQIHRPDTDRHLHDHPWKWALSIILAGSYDEQRIDCVKCKTDGRFGTTVRDRRVRLWNLLGNHDFHRITKLHGDVFTLFVAGPRTSDDKWGFLTNRGWVDSAIYIALEKETLNKAYRRVKR